MVSPAPFFLLGPVFTLYCLNVVVACCPVLLLRLYVTWHRSSPVLLECAGHLLYCCVLPQMDYWVRTAGCKQAKSKHIEYIDNATYSREQVRSVRCGVVGWCSKCVMWCCLIFM